VNTVVGATRPATLHPSDRRNRQADRGTAGNEDATGV